MKDKMEKVVQELRKRFRSSIEFYDVPMHRVIDKLVEDISLMIDKQILNSYMK